MIDAHLSLYAVDIGRSISRVQESLRCGLIDCWHSAVESRDADRGYRYSPG